MSEYRTNPMHEKISENVMMGTSHLSQEELDRLEFERDWENGLTIEEFRQLMKKEIRKRYAELKQQR